MSKWNFSLQDVVEISVSGETGTVIGRAEYASTDEPSYLVRYKAADGRAVEAWWQQSALELTAARLDG